MGLATRFQEWKAKRALRFRPGDRTCRRCGGQWVFVSENHGRQGVVMPSTSTMGAYPPAVVGAAPAFITWRCEGCGTIQQEET